MKECPDETTLSDFLAGLLSEEGRGRVLEHLEDCSSCQWVLDAFNGGGSAAPPRDEGCALSRYVVRKRLGSGAMGVVYAAHDPKLNRQVALKVLRPEGREVEALQQRLLLEAQALARLSHPNVVAIHDVGTHEGTVFLAMEMVEGTTLAQWLEQPRPWTQVLCVFREAGKGLAAAHAAGLVHRDFKPANLLVGTEGRVCVTDFGVARSVSSEEGSAPEALPGGEGGALSPLTRTGALLGTPAYMAPELMQGQRADARSDQFSFCVALHEALFGARPFEGGNLEELARAAREGTVRLPESPSKVPAWVRRAVMRGLRARPEERFPSMEALLAALAPPPWHRRVQVLAVAALAGLLGAAGAYGLAHRREALCEQEVERLSVAWGDERRERVRTAFLATGVPYAAVAWEKLAATLDAHASQWRALRTEACMAGRGDASEAAWQTATCLDARLWQLTATIEVLEKADERTVQNASRMAASLEGLSGCRDAPGNVTRPQPSEALRPRVDEARRKLAQARADLSAGRYPEGLGVTSALINELQGLDYRPLEAEVLLAHGELLGKSGKPKEAEEILYKALWAAEAGRDDESVARAWVLLLWVVGNELARAEDAERITRHAQAAVERLGRDRFPVITADLHFWLAVVLRQRGNLDRAEAEAVEGLEYSRRVHGPESRSAALFMQVLGQIRYSQQRAEEALALNRQALELLEPAMGSTHPSILSLYNNLALSTWMVGRREEALATWRRAVALHESARAPEHLTLAAPLHNLGRLLRVEGQLEEARKHLERARAIFERAHGPDHPQVANSIGELSLVALDSGQLEEALSLCRQSVERFQRTVGPASPRIATPLMYCGMIHARAGRHAEARRDVLGALALQEKEHGSNSVRTTASILALAHIALSAGAPRESLAYCQRALEIDEGARQLQQLRDVALDLMCAAEAHLALGAPEAAAPLLERALRIHEEHPPLDELDAGLASFLMARALLPRSNAADRARAVALADEARTRMERLGLRARPELRKVTAWQRSEGLR